MPNKDRNIPWKIKTEYIPVHMMAGFMEATNLLTSLGSGATVFKEALAAAQISGIQMTTADEIFHYWPIPHDLDRDAPILFRLHFTHDAADLDSPVWKIFYKFQAKGLILVTANATEDEVLSITHAVAAAAGGLEITNWARSVSNTKIAASDLVALICVELDALGGSAADENVLLGLEIGYKVKAIADTWQDTKSVSLIS